MFKLHPGSSASIRLRLGLLILGRDQNELQTNIPKTDLCSPRTARNAEAELSILLLQGPFESNKPFHL